jgi:hypothetical protein
MNIPVQQVGGWTDFVGPLFSTALQVGGAVGTAALLNKFGGQQVPQTQQNQQPQLQQSFNQSAQWIEGVDNSVVVIGAIGILAVVIIATRNKK